jgi:hypothetical protein
MALKGTCKFLCGVYAEKSETKVMLREAGLVDGRWTMVAVRFGRNATTARMSGAVMDSVGKNAEQVLGEGFEMVG